jgi:uncharacterized membrane protein YtjA (UPF0391 family)
VAEITPAGANLRRFSTRGDVVNSPHSDQSRLQGGFMLLFKLQPMLVMATLAGLYGFCTMADVNTLTAQIMIGMAVVLLIAIQVTGWSDHPYKEPVAHI